MKLSKLIDSVKTSLNGAKNGNVYAITGGVGMYPGKPAEYLFQALNNEPAASKTRLVLAEALPTTATCCRPMCRIKNMNAIADTRVGQEASLTDITDWLRNRDERDPKGRQCLWVDKIEQWSEAVRREAFSQIRIRHNYQDGEFVVDILSGHFALAEIKKENPVSVMQHTPVVLEGVDYETFQEWAVKELSSVSLFDNCHYLDKECFIRLLLHHTNGDQRFLKRFFGPEAEMGKPTIQALEEKLFELHENNALQCEFWSDFRAYGGGMPPETRQLFRWQACRGNPKQENIQRLALTGIIHCVDFNDDPEKPFRPASPLVRRLLDGLGEAGLSKLMTGDVPIEELLLEDEYQQRAKSVWEHTQPHNAPILAEAAALVHDLELTLRRYALFPLGQTDHLGDIWKQRVAGSGQSESKTLKRHCEEQERGGCIGNGSEKWIWKNEPLICWCNVSILLDRVQGQINLLVPKGADGRLRDKFKKWRDDFTVIRNLAFHNRPIRIAAVKRLRELQDELSDLFLQIELSPKNSASEPSDFPLP